MLFCWIFINLFDIVSLKLKLTSGGENTRVQFEKLHFNQYTIDSLNRFAKNYRFNITYYYGYIVIFDKANICAISLHKILFSKIDVNLLVLHYGDYMENENLYFVDEEKSPFTIVTIKRYIKDYFKKNILNEMQMK